MDSQARTADDRQVAEELARRALLRQIVNDPKSNIESVMQVAFKAGWYACDRFNCDPETSGLSYCEAVTHEFAQWLLAL